MQMKNSPLSKVPPPNLPSIPGVTHPINSIAQRENQDISEEVDGKINTAGDSIPGMFCFSV
jgi:Eukaryotic translation initiation factor 4E binding protein (EIF4EBP)